MKKKLTILLAILFVLNCENQPIDVAERNQELILKRVNYKVIGSPDNCPGRFADFDSQGKIIEVFYECEGNTTILRTYTYTERGLIKGITGNLDFTYDENDILIKRSGGSDTGSRHFDFTYNNNFMYAQGYQNGVQSSKYTYEFEDDTYKRLISMKINNTSITDEITYSELYQYDGNNLIGLFIEQKFSDTTMLEPKIQITITYDNKINPYKLGLPTNAYLANVTVLSYFQQYNIAFTAENNITSVTINNLVNNTTLNFSNLYEYNNDMYPIEAIFHINGEPFRNEIFEYYQ